MASRRPKSDQPPLVVIVGETGSGKTALAIELAKEFNGEVISADSRTVYKGMDIGTAKPTVAERADIPHYGFDIVEPGEPFTAYDFQQLAYEAIGNISKQGKLPIIVGGTGLYIDAVLYGFTFRPAADPELRQVLQGTSVIDLQSRILAAGLQLPSNMQNPRHLARLLEGGEPPRQPRELRSNTLVLGLSLPTEGREGRIAKRVDAMLAAGLVGEVTRLSEQYGNVEALRAPGYKAFGAYVQGTISLAEARRQCIRDHLRLAKRQRTWFRRNLDIQWLSGDARLVTARTLVASFLANQRTQ